MYLFSDFTLISLISLARLNYLACFMLPIIYAWMKRKVKNDINILNVRKTFRIFTASALNLKFYTILVFSNQDFQIATYNNKLKSCKKRYLLKNFLSNIYFIGVTSVVSFFKRVSLYRDKCRK